MSLRIELNFHLLSFCVCVYVCVPQGHSTSRGHVSRAPEENSEQYPGDARTDESNPVRGGLRSARCCSHTTSSSRPRSPFVPVCLGALAGPACVPPLRRRRLRQGKEQPRGKVAADLENPTLKRLQGIFFRRMSKTDRHGRGLSFPKGFEAGWERNCRAVPLPLHESFQPWAVSWSAKWTR